MADQEQQQKQQFGICIESCELCLMSCDSLNKMTMEIGTMVSIIKSLPNRHVIRIYDETDLMYNKITYMCNESCIRKIDGLLYMYALSIKTKHERVKFVKNQSLVKYVLNIKENNEIQAWEKEHPEQKNYIVVNTKKLDVKRESSGFYFEVMVNYSINSHFVNVSFYS